MKKNVEGRNVNSIYIFFRFRRKKIEESMRSSPHRVTVHRTVTFEWVQIYRTDKNKKPNTKRCSAFHGGGRWIRTTEAISSRFTVCPLWPLGNSPRCSAHTELLYYSTESGNVKLFFQKFQFNSFFFRSRLIPARIRPGASGNSPDVPLRRSRNS